MLTSAQRATGPQPRRTTVDSETSFGVRSLKALCAANQPVGKMSAMRTRALSEIPSGALTAVESARGTRTWVD